MEATDYLQFVLAFVFVIGLIMGLAWLLKRFGVGDGATNTLGRKRRLSTVESSSIDARHRLVLVRRDDVEHLVLVGPSNSLVVEHGIKEAAGRAQSQEPV